MGAECESDSSVCACASERVNWCVHVILLRMYGMELHRILLSNERICILINGIAARSSNTHHQWCVWCVVVVVWCSYICRSSNIVICPVDDEENENLLTHSTHKKSLLLLVVDSVFFFFLLLRMSLCSNGNGKQQQQQNSQTTE